MKYEAERHKNRLFLHKTVNKYNYFMPAYDNVLALESYLGYLMVINEICIK